MELLTGVPKTLSSGEYFYTVEVSAGTAKLTSNDSGVISDVTNSDKTANFTGTVKFGNGVIVTAVLTGDAKVAISLISGN